MKNKLELAIWRIAEMGRQHVQSQEGIILV